METFEKFVDRQTLTRLLGKNELSFTVKSSHVNYLISWNVPWDIYKSDFQSTCVRDTRVILVSHRYPGEKMQ